MTIGALAGCSDGTSGDGADGDTETETQTPTPSPEPTPSPKPTANPTPTGTAAPATETVLVGPDAQNVFEPASLEIPAGTAVTFVWESSGHSLVVDSQPDGASWAGVSETQSSGYEHSHTFEVPGAYEYHCGPHEAFGMEGTITVTE
jgi:plastocyanin